MIEIIHNALKVVNTSSTNNSWPGEGALIIGRKFKPKKNGRVIN